MNTQIFSLLTFVFAASACSVPTEEADSQYPTDVSAEYQVQDFSINSGIDNLAPSNVVIVDESEKPLAIPGAMVVDEIAELDVVVYELEAGTQLDEKIPHQEDKLFSLDNDLRLGDSDLGDAMSDDKNRFIGFMGSIPTALEEIGYENQHRMTVFAEGEEELYESELIQELVKSTEGPIEYIHLPVPQENVSDMLYTAIEYVQKEGVRVFDRNGELF